MTITWSCHVCGLERPDAQISVHKRRLRSRSTGIEVGENVRYCNDNPSCVAAAPSHRFMPEHLWEEIAR